MLRQQAFERKPRCLLRGELAPEQWLLHLSRPTVYRAVVCDYAITVTQNLFCLPGLTSWRCRLLILRNLLNQQRWRVFRLTGSPAIIHLFSITYEVLFDECDTAQLGVQRGDLLSFCSHPLSKSAIAKSRIGHRKLNLTALPSREGIMGRINYGRLFLGGLLAGSVANLLQFIVNRLYLFRAWGIANGLLALPNGRTKRASSWISFGAMTLVGSIFAVWLYALASVPTWRRAQNRGAGRRYYWLLSWVFPVVLWSLSGRSRRSRYGFWPPI